MAAELGKTNNITMSLRDQRQQQAREKAVRDILRENERRNRENNRLFNPITGEGSVGQRKKVVIEDFPIDVMYLPVLMLQVPLIKKLVKAGSITAFLTEVLKVEDTEEERHKVVEQVVRVRYQYDFAFWAAMLVYISPKDGGDNILFWLNRPQRRYLATLERMRKAGKPIFIILLKARQWGGSTLTQFYMVWIQMFHKKNWNSLSLLRPKGVV